MSFGAQRVGRPFHHLIPAFVALLVVVVTLLALLRVVALQHAEDRDRFRIETRSILRTLRARVRYQERLLDAIAGLYAVAPGRRLPTSSWYRFIHQLEPLRHSPGLVAVMHIRAHFPGQTRTCIVDRYWPEDVAEKVLGVDACRNKHVRSLLLHALPGGAIQSSAPFRVWGLHAHPTLGVALVRAVSPAGGLRAPSGWIVLVLSLPRLMSRLGAADHMHLGLVSPLGKVVYLKGDPSGWGRRRGGFFSDDLGGGGDLSIGGHLWRVSFERVYPAGLLPVVLLSGGAIVAVLAYLIVFLLVRTEERASVLAERLTERLNRNFELLRSITNNVSEGIYRSRAEGGVIFCNKALAEIFGYPTVQELLHVDPARLYVHPERRRELLELLARDKRYERVEVEMLRRSGERFVALESARATFAPDGSILYIDGVIADITNLRQAESRAVYLDQYDKDTGLPNRTLIRDRIHQSVESTRREGTFVAVADFDLDRFIAVNDVHGHEVGDVLLRQLGKSFQALDPALVSVGRVGEDEFLAVATLAAGSYSEILILIEKLQATVADTYRLYAPDVGGTAAVGVSLFPGDARNEEELLLHAGAALREAKSRAPGAVVFYSAQTHDAALNETKLTHRLQELVVGDRFGTAFQPIVDLASGRVVSLEVLARWPHDVLPIVSPEVFIPLAERRLLIGRIERSVWKQAFLAWRQWRGQPWSPSSLSVNVSLRHLLEEDFIQSTFRLLDETAMKPSELVLELTETNLLSEPERLHEIFTRLVAGGIRLAVDDFGTGYSGLSLLRRFPVSILKLDRSCVDNVADDPNARVIARAVAGLARDLSLELVAEGVERAVDRDVLLEFGYRRFQGFLYAPPLDAQDLAAFVSSFSERSSPPFDPRSESLT
jgi:diguanylate cyclase (GGDEF)-like protein/PAS domain S-box-containing protein